MTLSSNLYADDIKGTEVCQKVKSCALEVLGTQEIPEQAKQGILTQLDTQCAKSFSEREQSIKDAGLVDQANACADEMIALPCGELLSPDVLTNSKVCAAFEESYKKAESAQ